MKLMKKGEKVSAKLRQKKRMPKKNKEEHLKPYNGKVNEETCLNQTLIAQNQNRKILEMTAIDSEKQMLNIMKKHICITIIGIQEKKKNIEMVEERQKIQETQYLTT